MYLLLLGLPSFFVSWSSEGGGGCSAYVACMLKETEPSSYRDNSVQWTLQASPLTADT